MKPFDFVNAINFSKEDLIRDSDNAELAEKIYAPYLTNKSLSYFTDTILLVNEINQRAQADNILQFDFLINSVRKRKRFSKWYKREQNEDLELIANHYGYSYEKAKQVLPLFTEEQLNIIKKKNYKGGVDGC